MQRAMLHARAELSQGAAEPGCRPQDTKLHDALVIWISIWRYSNEQDIMAGLAVEVMKGVEDTLTRARAYQ